MKHTGTEIINLGTGHGYSVLDIVKAFEKVNGVKVPYKIEARRPGDIAECWADPAKAKELLGWTAQKNLEDMRRMALADTEPEWICGLRRIFGIESQRRKKLRLFCLQSNFLSGKSV